MSHPDWGATPKPLKDVKQRSDMIYDCGVTSSPGSKICGGLGKGSWPRGWLLGKLPAQVSITRQYRNQAFRL